MVWKKVFSREGLFHPIYIGAWFGIGLTLLLKPPPYVLILAPVMWVVFDAAIFYWGKKAKEKTKQ